MLVFSKTMKDKRRTCAEQLNMIPSPIKDQMIAFRETRIKYGKII